MLETLWETKCCVLRSERILLGFLEEANLRDCSDWVGGVQGLNFKTKRFFLCYVFFCLLSTILKISETNSFLLFLYTYFF